MRNGLVRVALFLVAMAALSSAAWAQPFFDVSALNPGADSDTGADLQPSMVVGPDGRIIHFAWASTDNYTGTAGTDFDIYYSYFPDANGEVSPPVLVNKYGASDSGVDSFPKLAVDAKGVLHCVWQTTSTYGGSGTDSDIVYAYNDGSGWSVAELVNDAAADNANPSHVDVLPNLTLRPDGTVVVAWSSNYPTPSGAGGGIGTDFDILYSIRGGSGWSAPAPLTSHFAADTGDDDGPVALTTDADGKVTAAWSSNDPLRPVNGKGTDFDIVYSVLPPGGVWSEPVEVCALARSDSQPDLWPAIVSVGSGSSRMVHVVWTSQEDYQGAGNDWDIFHTILPALQFLPVNNPTYLVNSTATIDGPADNDLCPTLLAEPGGVVHCAWQSNYNLYGLSGTDVDIFHSLNASHGGEWSPPDLLNWSNGLQDAVGENDELPCLAIYTWSEIAPLLIAVWQSTDDTGGTGSDYDIFVASGCGKMFSRPDWINASAPADAPTVGVDADQHVRFAVDPDGVLHAVWSSKYAGLAGGQAGGDGDIYHATLGANGWTAPQQVNTNGTTDTGTDRMPDIAIDAFGNITVAWASNEDFGGVLGADGDILYSTHTGGGWSAPAPVNSNAAVDSKPDGYPRLVAAPGGTLHCAWVSDLDGINLKSNISYASRGASGWSAAEYVDAPFATPPQGYNLAPDMALDVNGAPHVVWQSSVNYQSAGVDNDIFYSTRAGGSWSAPQFVNDATNDGADDRDPCIARDPDGTLYVIWSADLNIQGAGTDRDLFGSKMNGGVWDAPNLLSPSGASDTTADEEPSAVFDARGLLHVVWRGSPNLYGSGTDQDILYMIFSTSHMISFYTSFFANTSAFADAPWDDYDPCVAVDRNGRVHVGWESAASLGDVIGNDEDALHSWADLVLRWFPGAPMTESAWDAGNGLLHLGWVNYWKDPAQYLGFAWDIYTGQWVLGGWENTLWHVYPLGSFQGDLAVTNSGGYHAWISNQYADGSWYPCTNPWTGIVYCGTPHTPLNATATALGSKKAHISWKPEIYGTWHYQIAAYNVETAKWVNTTGPSGNSLWQFVFYPGAAFMAGQVDLTVPSAGDYWFYIRTVGWLPSQPASPFATPFVHVN